MLLLQTTLMSQLPRQGPLEELSNRGLQLRRRMLPPQMMLLLRIKLLSQAALLLQLLRQCPLEVLSKRALQLLRHMLPLQMLLALRTMLLPQASLSKRRRPANRHARGRARCAST